MLEFIIQPPPPQRNYLHVLPCGVSLRYKWKERHFVAHPSSESYGFNSIRICHVRHVNTIDTSRSTDPSSVSLSCNWFVYKQATFMCGCVLYIHVKHI
ncbi:hypothetical protein J6590_070421 [Homalodisca vitripennis]|nr:hypothetical protein J6590_070421 [Homalodisca vitripennis]